MIVQCEQCATRFKLDDSKVRDEGVKVRCSKCKHIFTVRKERPVQPEDTDFDSLLSGLVTAPQDSFPASVNRPDLSQSMPQATETSPETVPTEQSSEAASVSFGFDDGVFTSTSGDEAEQSTFEHEATREDEESPFAFAVETTQTPITKEPPAGQPESPFDFGFEEGEQPAAIETALGKDESPFDFTFETTQTPTDKEPPVNQDEQPFDFSFESGQQPAEEAETTEPSPFDFSFDHLESKPADFESEKENVALPHDKQEEIVPSELNGAAVFGFEDTSSATDIKQENQPFEFDTDQVEDVAKPSETIPDSGVTGFPDDRSKKPAISAVTHEEADRTEQVKASDTAPAAAEQTDSAKASGFRRKENTLLPITVTVISVIVIITLAGAGFYMLNKGPTAFENLGLGSITKLVGIDKEQDGVILIRNTTSEFMKNREFGEIMIIKGEAVNAFTKPRASIQVKATLHDAKGTVLGSRSAYCGNPLTREQLTTLPLAKIESAMGNQFGDSLSNMGVQPGKAIPFIIVFSNVPMEAKEFALEIAGSTVSSK